MNKLCQQYLSDVKVFFPILGSPEKKFLTKLADTVEDYCIEEAAITIEEIYNGFGAPSDVANTYFTNVDTSHLIKRIRITKWIKTGIIALLLIVLVGVSIYGIKSYNAYKVFEQDQIYFDETNITD